MPVSSHHDNVFNEDREVPVYIFGLWDVGDDVLFEGGFYGVSGDGDAAGCWFDKAHHGFKKCGFSCAINTHEAANYACVKVRAYGFKGGVTIGVGDAYIVEFYDVFHFNALAVV